MVNDYLSAYGDPIILSPLLRKDFYWITLALCIEMMFFFMFDRILHLSVLGFDFPLWEYL